MDQSLLQKLQRLVLPHQFHEPSVSPSNVCHRNVDIKCLPPNFMHQRFMEDASEHPQTDFPILACNFQAGHSFPPNYLNGSPSETTSCCSGSNKRTNHHQSNLYRQFVKQEHRRPCTERSIHTTPCATHLVIHLVRVNPWIPNVNKRSTFCPPKTKKGIARAFSKLNNTPFTLIFIGSASTDL
jgi:hypothetical protein